MIRLQCYEGLDESKALYEWNYKKQLLRIQAAGKSDDSGTDEWDELSGDIFSDEFLLTRPLLEAITADDPVVLLIDEVDRVEVETEALLLEILSDYTVSIPELGTIEAKQIPMVFLTSNNTRELSEALKRRCLYLHVDYPDLEREKEIVLTKVPDITESLADQVARIVRSIRNLELKKSPSVSETLDWARTLLLLGVEPDRRRDGPQHHRHPAQVPVGHRQGAPRARGRQVRHGEGHRRGGRRIVTDTRPGARARRRRGDQRAAGRVHPGAAGGRPAGQPHREPGRHGGGQAHPARGPRGVQVRARRHAGEEQLALARLRDRLRGVLQLPGSASTSSTRTASWPRRSTSSWTSSRATRARTATSRVAVAPWTP